VGQQGDWWCHNTLYGAKLEEALNNAGFPTNMDSDEMYIIQLSGVEFFIDGDVDEDWDSPTDLIKKRLAVNGLLKDIFNDWSGKFDWDRVMPSAD